MTVGADKNYDTKDFVAEARNLNATPHVAQNIHARRSNAIDGRTTRHAGYAISQIKRKRVEEIFGWMKTVGGMRKLRHRGLHALGGLDVHLRGRRIQSGAHAEPGPRKCWRGCMRSSVSKCVARAQAATKPAEKKPPKATHVLVGLMITPPKSQKRLREPLGIL